jgi:hypothetical protein
MATRSAGPTTYGFVDDHLEQVGKVEDGLVGEAAKKGKRAVGDGASVRVGELLVDQKRGAVARPNTQRDDVAVARGEGAAVVRDVVVHA